jgi:hypothetical protein
MLDKHFIHFAPDDGSGSGGGDGGGDGGGSSQEDGNDTTPPAGDGGSQGGADDEKVPASEAREARREAQKLRQRAKAAEEELERLKNAGQSDDEKQTREVTKRDKQIASLTTENRSLRVQVLAKQAGIHDDFVDVAPSMLDWDELEDDGPASNKEVLRALKQLVKDRPSLAGGGKRPSADGGAGRQERSGGGGDMNSILRGAVGIRSGGSQE